MRWFKHMTNSIDDEKISKLVDECGLEGYGFFWRVLEMIAAQVDDDGKNYCSYSKRAWCNKLAIKHQTWSKLIASCEQAGLFEVSDDGQTITVKSPNILKYRDEWSRKKAKNSGVPPEKLRSDSGVSRARFSSSKEEEKTETETETEEERDARETRGTPPASPAPPALPDEKFLAFARRFQNEVSLTHGNTAPRVTEQLVVSGAEELDRAERLDGFDWQEMQHALMWAVHDDFWGQNLKSLARMRSKTRTGVTKLQSVVGEFRKRHGAQSQSDRWAGAI